MPPPGGQGRSARSLVGAGVANLVEAIQQPEHVLRQAKLFDGQLQEFLAAVTVLGHGGGVHGEEAEGLQIVHPHGLRIGVEQQPVTLFAGSRPFCRGPVRFAVATDAQGRNRCEVAGRSGVIFQPRGADAVGRRQQGVCFHSVVFVWRITPEKSAR